MARLLPRTSQEFFRSTGPGGRPLTIEEPFQQQTSPGVDPVDTGEYMLQHPSRGADPLEDNAITRPRSSPQPLEREGRSPEPGLPPLEYVVSPEARC